MTPPIPNFAKVDGTLWRGARPETRAQAQWLVAEGARSIINLEWEQTDAYVFRDLLSPFSLYCTRTFEPLPWLAPSMEDRHIRSFMRHLRAAKHPTFVHCRSGQNRTGVAVAAYRLIELGDPIEPVLQDFASYRGWWARADTSYIRDLATRLNEFR